MGIRRVGAFLRWAVRVLGLLVRGMIALFLFGEGFGPRRCWVWPSALLYVGPSSVPGVDPGSPVAVPGLL